MAPPLVRCQPFLPLTFFPCAIAYSMFPTPSAPPGKYPNNVMYPQKIYTSFLKAGETGKALVRANKGSGNPHCLMLFDSLSEGSTIPAAAFPNAAQPFRSEFHLVAPDLSAEKTVSRNILSKKIYFVPYGRVIISRQNGAPHDAAWCFDRSSELDSSMMASIRKMYSSSGRSAPTMSTSASVK